MSTLTDIKKCSRCGRAAYSEWRPSSGEEHIFCSWCGYQEHLNVEFNPSGTEYRLAKRDIPACGVCCIAFKNGRGKQIAFRRPLSWLRKRCLLLLFRAPNIDQKNSYLTVWDNKQKKAVVLFGKEQPEYTETERDFY